MISFETISFVASGCRAGAVALLLLACATPPPPAPAAPPAEPAPAPAAPPAPLASAAPSDFAPPAAPPAAEPAAPEPAKETERRQPPITMLTARDAAFLVDYANSGARQMADAECDKESKGDPQVKGTCLEKAREKFLPDVLRFKKDEQHGKTSLLVYKRSGSTLREIYVGAIELVNETETGVSIKFLGREKGVRPLFRSGKAEVVVPNDYSIEIEDPQWGKLTYNAKIGLVSAD